MKSNTFFSATNDAYESINGMFNFLWPSAVALWNLKWQLVGFKTVKPDATVSEINSKFANGLGLHNFDFNDLVQSNDSYIINGISETLLINYFAVYEGWLEDVVRIAFKDDKIAIKQLQFPTNTNPISNGVLLGLSRIKVNQSAFLNTYYQPVLKQHKKYRLEKLNNLLYCYRVFKEMRNCIVHNKKRVSEELINTYNEYQVHVRVPDDIGTKELPELSIGDIGSSINLNIRGLVGFSEVILILMTTIDSELATTINSERYIINQYKEKAKGKTLSVDNEDKRTKTIKGIIKSQHDLRIAIDSQYIDFLQQNHVVNVNR